MARKTLGEMMGPFVMFRLVPESPYGLVGWHLKERRIQSRDVTLLFLMIENFNPVSGRIWMTAQDMADALGHRTTSGIVPSLSRLKQAGLIAKGLEPKDPRRWFYCVNPDVCCTGGSLIRARQQEQFLRASERWEQGRKPLSPRPPWESATRKRATAERGPEADLEAA